MEGKGSLWTLLVASRTRRWSPLSRSYERQRSESERRHNGGVDGETEKKTHRSNEEETKKDRRKRRGDGGNKGVFVRATLTHVVLRLFHGFF